MNSELSGFLLSKIAAKVDQRMPQSFLCDTCEKEVSGAPFTSDMLPFFRGCSVACRDEAEHAAIDVRRHD